MAAVSGVVAGDPVVVPFLVTEGVVGFPPKLNNPPSDARAVSSNGTPVLIVPRLAFAASGESDSCGIPSLARIYGSVGSAPPSNFIWSLVSPA